MSNSPSSTTGRLAELSSLGGYFALTVDVPGQSRSLTEFFTDTVLDGHIAATRAAIARSADAPADRIPIRMAASSFQLGVAARLLSPVIGAAVCLGAAPVLDHGSVRWVPSDGHAPQFAVRSPAWVDVGAATAAPFIVDTVVGVLVELGDRLHTLVGLSSQVTLGNLTSAANGAVTVLAMSHPAYESAGRALIRTLLDIEPLSGTGAFTATGFRRNSCCLYYQGPGGGLCGDCVLIPQTSP